jgi:hypothetical protein
MGLLDDLLGPLRDIASVKDEVTQSFTEVTDTLNEAKDQITQPLEGSIDAPAEDVKEPTVEEK